MPFTASTIRQRERLSEAQDGFCPACGYAFGDLADTEVDHIIPRSRGGPNAPWNYQLLHWRCNRVKRVKLTPAAEALAAKHGVRLHIPLGDTHIADRPLTWADSLFVDYLNEMDKTPVTDVARREAIGREYLDTRKYLDEAAAKRPLGVG